MMFMNNRRDDIDYARGIAMLLIVIGHTPDLNSIVVKVLYSFHVPLFFIITGMLIAYTRSENKSWKYIIIGMIKRIVIPMSVWEIFTDVMYCFTGKDTLVNLLKNTMQLDFNLGVLWFLPCTMFAQIVVIASEKALKDNDFRGKYFFILSVSMIAGIMCPWIRLKRCLIAIAFLEVGLLYEKYFKNSKKALGVCAIIWAITMCLNSKVDLSAGLLGNPFFYILHSTCGSFVIIMLCKYIRNNNVLKWIGQNTIGILMTHTFVRHFYILLEEKILGSYYGGWSMAFLIVVTDLMVVVMLEKIVPFVIGKRTA